MGTIIDLNIDLTPINEAIQGSNKVKKILENINFSNLFMRFGDVINEAVKSSEKLENSADNLEKSNKKVGKVLKQNTAEYKKQNKELNKSLQSMKVMRMMSSSIKMGLGALGIGAGIGGLIAAITKPYNNNLSRDLRVKNINATVSADNEMSMTEADALAYAGKMTGLGEDTLISAIEGLSTSLNDFEQWGNFASLGLSASSLRNENPAEVLFEVLKAVKGSGFDVGMKKNIFDSIGIPFDQFKFLLKEDIGNIEKYFKEGKKLNKDNDAYNPRLKNAERETIKFTETFSGMMKHISYDIAPAYITGMQKITDLFPKLEKTLSKSIMWSINFVEGFAETPEENRALYFSEQLWKPLGDALGGAFQTAISSLGDKLKEQFKPFTEGWEELKEKGLFGYITGAKKLSVNTEADKTFKKNGIGINNYNMAFNALAQGDEESLKLLIEAFKENKLTKKESEMLYNVYLGKNTANKLGFTKEDFFDKYEPISVNDAVITPDNQVITTSPKDYIIAMKRPQELISSSSGGGNTYTININANVRNDNDIKQLRNELERLIRSFNAKR